MCMSSCAKQFKQSKSRFTFEAITLSLNLRKLCLMHMHKLSFPVILMFCLEVTFFEQKNTVKTEHVVSNYPVRTAKANLRRHFTHMH